MNEKKNLQNIFQEFSQIQEKNQWMMVYQVVLSDACWLEHVFKTPNVSFTQKIKDASRSEETELHDQRVKESTKQTVKQVKAWRNLLQ
jgi:hypothetical protein